MQKLSFILICLITSTCLFSQSERFEVEGAIIISDNDDPNPVEGTIRYKDQEFEGFNGTRWISLSCGCDDLMQSTKPEISCPEPSTILEDCSLTVNWTHENPVSTTVNYDLRINGIDPGLSVTYPATSNTINVCDILQTTVGSGTLDVELLYWYDNDLDNIDSIASCQINYDFASQSNHGQGKTFSQIEANAPVNFCAPDGDEAYIAEYLYQNPGVVYWNVATLNGEKCVIPVDPPTVPAGAIQLPNPSGGDDTQALESIINSNPGGNFVGSGGPYRLNSLDVTVSANIWNVPAVPLNTTTGIIWFIKAADVRIYNSPIDGLNSTGFSFGWRVEDGAHRFHLINSGCSNVRVTDGGSMSAVQIRSADDFHIAGNVFKDLLNASGSAQTSRANAIWMVDSGGSTSGGYIVNNTGENFQTNGTLKDAEFFTKQSYNTVGLPTKIYANRCINAGKRFVKFQNAGGIVLSNDAVWTEKAGNSGIGDRTLLTFAAPITNANNVAIRNNRFTAEAATNGLFDRIFSIGPNGNASANVSEVHIDCNYITVNADTQNPNVHNPRIFYFVAKDGGGYERFSQCSVNDNYITGSGNIAYYWDFKTNGLPSFNWPLGNLEMSGNQFFIPWHTAEYK